MTPPPPPRLTHDPERRREIAHVGPVELYTPDLNASRDFFVNQMGLREVHRDATSAYLHTWDDYQSWTVRLIQRDAAGIGRTYLRATSPQAVQRLAAEIDKTGLGRGFVKDVYNLGEVYTSTIPTATRWACTGTSTGTSRTIPTGRG